MHSLEGKDSGLLEGGDGNFHLKLNLARLLEEHGDVSEAEPLYRQCLHDCRATHAALEGWGNSLTFQRMLQSMVNLASLLRKSGKVDEAEAAASRRAAKVEHPVVPSPVAVN